MVSELVTQAFDKAQKETNSKTKHRLCMHIQKYLERHHNIHGDVYRAFKRAYKNFYKNPVTITKGIPRKTTLDMLAQYLLYEDYQDFLDNHNGGIPLKHKKPPQLQSQEQVIKTLEGLLTKLDYELVDDILKSVFENRLEGFLNVWGESHLKGIFQRVLEEQLQKMERKLMRSRKLYQRFGGLGLLLIGTTTWESTLDLLQEDLISEMTALTVGAELDSEGYGADHGEAFDDMV